MKINIKNTLLFLLLFAAAVHGLSLDRKTALLEKFEFQGRPYSLVASFAPPQADIVLHGQLNINLSAEMEGENIFLGNKTGRDNIYTFWINYSHSTIRLALYDLQQNRSRVLALTDFSFIGLPEIFEIDRDLQGLVFLGNRFKNDDIFYYDLEKDLLTQLTETPFSEKGFTLQEKDGQLQIETSSLWAHYRYRFDPVQLKISLVEKNQLANQRQKPAADLPPTYYNTYIGFGDSITWGKFEGEQHLEFCYLTQMKTILEDPDNANYYGSSDSINLGVPGNTTLDGVNRISQNLNIYKGLYFLLMLGFNDILNSSNSVDSSLENLDYIIDIAKANGMRVIVSTPTPSQSSFSEYEYYWMNLYSLSAGILALAEEKNVASIDPLEAFLSTNPPNGWKSLLEDIIPPVSSGNHPNAEGHRIIAGLFADVLTTFPPLPPSGIHVINPQDTIKKNVQWDANYESDFSHFAIEFDFAPPPLTHRLTTTDNHFTFNLFPFLPTLYFRLKTVDRGDRASDFSEVFSGQNQVSTPAKRLWEKR
ncbi:MAG: SGNH/GDSL hydrolase family protein [Candidatus Aminicenantes bacterium]|nr:SGNH/GDSL hydrolase family protein [Candidatus Aminicenantes bacterium]